MTKTVLIAIVLNCLCAIQNNAQIKIASNIGHGYLANEKASGYFIDVSISKKFKHRVWGVSFINYLSESEGLFVDKGGIKYFHDYTGRALEFPSAGIPYTGLKVLKTKADKFTMSGINIFGERKIRIKGRNQFSLKAGLGLYLVNIIHVDYVIYPDYFKSELFGEYIGPPFDLPIFRFQKYLDVGLDVSMNYQFYIKDRYGIDVNTGINWIPVSQNLIIKIGAGFFLYNKSPKTKTN